MNPFPYRDTDKIQKDFSSEFSVLNEEYCFTADFNCYWANIAGVVSYVLKGRIQEIPHSQIQKLKYNFFELFPGYKFLEDHLKRYPLFYREYTAYERGRRLLLLLLNEMNYRKTK